MTPAQALQTLLQCHGKRVGVSCDLSLDLGLPQFQDRSSEKPSQLYSGHLPMGVVEVHCRGRLEEQLAGSRKQAIGSGIEDTEELQAGEERGTARGPQQAGPCCGRKKGPWWIMPWTGEEWGRANQHMSEELVPRAMLMIFRIDHRCVCGFTSLRFFTWFHSILYS